MKFIRNVSSICIVGILLFSCNKEKVENFEATFTGEYVNVITGEELSDCPENFQCRVFVNFEGTATQLGMVTGQFNFCACGPDGAYGPTESFFVSEEGDSLFFSCQGKVIEGKTTDHPDFVTSYWRDPFVFTRGTGKFEGIKGEGTTDDYNSSQDQNSHHHWKGSIVLKK